MPTMATLARRGLTNKELLELVDRKDKEIEQLDKLLKDKVRQIERLQKYVDEVRDVLNSPESARMPCAELLAQRGRGLGISGEPSPKEASEGVKTEWGKQDHFKKSDA